MGTDRLSGIACAGSEQRLACMQTFAAWTWSLFSCLVIVPLFYLARRWGSESIGWLSCLLYMATPTVNIFTLHLDQVLFPLLSVLIVGCTALALDRGSRLFAIVAGSRIRARSHRTSFKSRPHEIIVRIAHIFYVRIRGAFVACVAP
jgi:hypothetical protein